MTDETRPRVLIVYFTLTGQADRVADAIATALEARGCEPTKARIEFTDERWVKKLSQFPMRRPMAQIASVLPAQMRHRTGEIRIPGKAQTGDYDLVVIASPTWWFRTCIPIRSYLKSPAAKAILDRQTIRDRVDLPALLQHQPQGTAKARRKQRRAIHRQDAFRGRRWPGQVDAFVARLHEARGATGSRHRTEDAAAESEARLRGTGPSLRRRPRGQSSASSPYRGVSLRVKAHRLDRRASAIC